MNTHHQKLKIKLLPILVTVAYFMQMLDSSILNTAIPSIAYSFGVAPIKLDITVTAFVFTSIILMPVSGWLAERFLIKRVFLTAIVIFTVGSLLCAMSTNLVELTLSRVVQGVGGAMLLPVGRLAALKVIPRKDYIRVISLILMPASVGPILGPTVGGFLTEYLSWHWVFLINVPIGLACFIAALYLMPYIRRSERIAFDGVGFAIFDLIIVSMFLLGANDMFFRLPVPLNIAMILGFIALYYFYARKQKHAIFDMALFKVKNFSVGMGGTFIVRLVAQAALPFLTPLFLQTALGFSPFKSGMAIIPLNLGIFFAHGLCPKLLNKYGYRKFLIYITVIFSILLSSLYFVEASTPMWILLLLFVFIGLANYMQYVVLTTLPTLDVPNSLLSESNSMQSVVLLMSMAWGVSLAAWLVEHLSTINALSTVAQFHIAYLALAVFGIVTGSILIFIKK
jgi:EmrB/QacA subfamily drug resistance transporter